MAYGEPNSHATDDVTWPWKVKVMTPMKTDAIQQQTLILNSLPWGSTAGYPSDSLTSRFSISTTLHKNKPYM